MWKLTIQDDQGNETLVHLVRDDYTIGRSEENAVRLTERNVSRKHARIALAEGGWHLHDLTSYNGCYVNGARVADAQNLAHGDLIQLGDYRLTVEDDSLVASRENGVLTLPGRSGRNMQADRMVVIAGPGQGQEFVLNGQRAVIGRGEECEIAINHPSVSRVHAEIRPIGDGRYEIVDLGSANGVRVNGVELPNSLLDARDVIELGDVIMRFLPAGEIYAPGADETFHPPPVTSGGLSTWSKVGMGAGLVVAAGAVLIGLTLGGAPKPTAPLAQTEDDGLGRTLSEAKGLLARGDAQGAMEKAEQIPASSNLRNSSDFKLIQSAWADDLFGKAAASPDPAEKRSLLDKIARAATLDPVRRKRAANELDAMRQAAVNVDDLPSEDVISVESSDSAAPQAPDALDGDAKAAGPAKKPPGFVASKAPVPATTPLPAAAKASAAPKTQKPPSSGATLVRQNPFDDP
ncbi:MAG TPA: FHA domain-containing protein [Polyangiaceae bacterium]|nr:FHA domain-containing protein [Polyangiaceae bacterium]